MTHRLIPLSIFVILQFVYTQIHSQRLDIRVYPQLVAFDNGEQLPTLDKLDTTKFILNTIFNHHDIYFHYECPKVICSNDAASIGQDICELEPYFHRDGIDMFILPDRSQSGHSPYAEVGFAEGIPGTAFYVSGVKTYRDTCDYTGNTQDPLLTGNPFTDDFVRRVLDGAARNGIVAHEMGHCLGLFHTFEDDLVLNTGCQTPITYNSCPELVDGSNCTTCGDFVCDTPADHLDYDCDTYVGTATDANGDLYDPLPHNIMTYTQALYRHELTQGQVDRIRTQMTGRDEVYNGPSREFCDLKLCCDYDTKMICLKDKSCQLLLGDYCGSGMCNWEWISPPLGFNAPACIPIEKNQQYAVRLWNGSSFRYLKYDPNEGCKSEEAVIRSSKITTDPQLIEDITVYPNPVTEFLNIDSEIENLEFQIFTIQGSPVLNGTVSNRKVEVSALSSGIYLIKLTSPGSIQTKTTRVVKM